MKTLSALKVRRKFGGALDRVTNRRIPVTICRTNKPLAILIPADEYKSKSSGREHRLRLTADHIAEWKSRHHKKRHGLDSTRLLRKTRESGDGGGCLSEPAGCNIGQ